MVRTAQRTLSRTDLARNWGWLLTLGIIFVILGCIGLGMLVGLTLASMFFLGILLIIGGISQFVDVFKSSSWKAMIWHAFIAALYIIGGAIIICDPLLASTLVTALLASVLIIIGVTRFIMAVQLKQSTGAVWLLLGGLVSIILGILILLQWPVSGLWVIGLFIAIELIFSGWTYIFLALSIRHLKKA